MVASTVMFLAPTSSGVLKGWRPTASRSRVRLWYRSVFRSSALRREAELSQGQVSYRRTILLGVDDLSKFTISGFCPVRTRSGLRLYCSKKHFITLYCTKKQFITPYCSKKHCITLYSTKKHCIYTLRVPQTKILIGLFRLSHIQEPSPVPSLVPFLGLRTFTGSFFGSFQEQRTFLHLFHGLFLKVK